MELVGFVLLGALGFGLLVHVAGIIATVREQRQRDKIERG